MEYWENVQKSLETKGYFLSDGVDVSALKESFARLPLDPFIEGDYRFRRLSRFVSPAGRLRALPHAEFVQSDQYNLLLGNIRREYEEMEASVALNDGFINLISYIQEHLKSTGETSVFGAHQIRITAEEDSKGEPAPEGIHKDGFDYVVITCVDRLGVEGGKTELYESLDSSPVFSEIIKPNQILFVDDKKLFHYTTNVENINKADAYRDVIVVTVKCEVS